MSTNLYKARMQGPTVEDMLHIEDSCWNFLNFLHALGVGSNYRVMEIEGAMERYNLDKGIVEYWYELYLERNSL